MTANEEGFLYPKIREEECIHCGLCEKTCPVMHNPDYPDDIVLREAWGAVIKNREILLESSSGGLFTALAQAIIASGGCVFGAALSDDFQAVRHVISENIEDLARLRGSKYIQSETGDIYRQVQDQLKMGREVLFSGTPCQIAGLKRFLGKDDDRLLLVDVICHGTPPASLWQKYLGHIEERMRGKAKEVYFRHKRNGWRKFGMQISKDKGICYYRSLQRDPYLKMFLRNVCLRESCYNCSVKARDDISDITIGDFWGVEKILLDWDSELGVSLALIHTEKGKKRFEEIKSVLRTAEVDYNSALKGNPVFNQSVSRPPQRDSFFLDMRNSSWRELEKRYARESVKIMIRRAVGKSLPGKVLSAIRNGQKVHIEGAKKQLEYGMMIVIQRT